MCNAETKYKVSVRLMCYNHEDFIRDAMDGIMMQETNFKVEVVVGDDFSEDDTLKIINEFESTRTIHIKILHREKGDEYWTERQKSGRLYNFQNILQNCNGEYIALLDGDDYWTDPLKLQKQVEVLEKYPNFKLCSHNHVFKYEHLDIEPVIRSEKTPKLLDNKVNNSDNLYEVSLKQYCKYYLTLHTHSLLFRNQDFEFPEWGKRVVSGDYVLILELLKKGPAVYIDDLMGVSRKHPGGITQIKKSGEEVYETSIYQLHKMIENLPKNCRKYYRVRLLKTQIKMIIGYGKFKMSPKKRLLKFVDSFYK